MVISSSAKAWHLFWWCSIQQVNIHAKTFVCTQFSCSLIKLHTKTYTRSDDECQRARKSAHFHFRDSPTTEIQPSTRLNDMIFWPIFSPFSANLSVSLFFAMLSFSLRHSWIIVVLTYVLFGVSWAELKPNICLGTATFFCCLVETKCRMLCCKGHSKSDRNKYVKFRDYSLYMICDCLCKFPWNPLSRR